MNMRLLSFLGDADGFAEDEYDNAQFLDTVVKAKEEWMAAQNYFDNVSDPDLVDYAIYKIEAARRKYMYLLKQARIKGIEDKHIFRQTSEGN